LPYEKGLQTIHYDILEAIGKIGKYVKGMSFDEFANLR
jgi:uncharacterized protein with HEPN domain